MKTIKLILILLGFTSIISTAQTSKSSRKLSRADCFFGIHFDLHATEDIIDAGRTLTAEMVDTFMTKVGPDFIQIDCKGHPGISSYPTKAGSHVKGFEKDPLKLFREVTAKHNIALFMHYSGVWDGKAVKDHPDWAIVNAKGEVSKEKTSFFSPYLDQILIPQMKELSDYGVDGAWIDGDSWAVEPDYGSASLSRFTRETGITAIPQKSSDKHYPEWMEYNRMLFREYMKKYIDAIHSYNPEFQITSNWSYSSMMPEPVKTNVDYLSGDVTPQNGVYRSAFEARCLAPQGKPWDLMAWGFSWNGGKMPMSIKSSIQLEQEAAQIMAMGGGVQFYFQQNRDLSLKPWLSKMLAEIAVFCRARQQYVHKAKAVPQIAILYPTASYQRNTTRPFSGSTAMLQGALNMVLDGQYPAEILMEHHLMGKMEQYPLIVIPECDFMEVSFKSELDNYVKNGGNLLIIGTETAKLFEKELGIKSMTKMDETPKFVAAANKLGGIGTSLVSVELNPEAQPIEFFYNSSDFNDKGKIIAASVNNVGKGRVAGIYFNAGSTYLDYKSPVLRDFIATRITELFPDPKVKALGSHMVHVAVNQLNNKMMINLVNVAGEHTNSKATGYDEIPALRDLTVTIRTLKKPERIMLQPEGVKLKIDYQNGISKVVVPQLAIYSILEVIL
jgi:hypothetical protein